MDFIKQNVKFRGGRLQERMAVIQIPLPFSIGMGVKVQGEDYYVRSGPIAIAIENDQQAIEHGMIILESRDE